MGIAANQARLMTLTARKNDLELKAQQISAIKMRLSQTSETMASDYANALNNYSKLASAQRMAEKYPDAKFIINVDGSFTQDESGAVEAADLLESVATKIGAAGSFTTANDYLTIQQSNYTIETDRISSQEKLYDMELTQVNTEHTAIKTEYDAIKSLIGENVDKSFNVFG